MKVLHVFDHSLPIHSGYSFRSAAILREQRKLGWQTLQFTTPRYNESNDTASGLPWLEFIRTPFPAFLRKLPTPVTLLAELVWTARYLVKTIRQEKVDLLHAHSPVLTALPALLAARLFGLPLVYEIRAFWEDAGVDLGQTKEHGLRYKATAKVESFVCRQADQVITICEGLKKDLILRGISPEKISVVGNGVDIEQFTPITNADEELAKALDLVDRPVIGFFGSFYAYEGLDLLVEAFKTICLRVPQARLLLVGGGPEEERLKALTTTLGLQDKIVFTGRVPNASIPKYYSLVDAVAFPRRSIRLTQLVTPLKPLEAMALGVPVLASDIGGHRELIDNGKTGVLFAPDDIDALSDATVALLKSKERRDSLSSNGCQQVESARTWTHTIANYKHAYQNAVT